MKKSIFCGCDLVIELDAASSFFWRAEKIISSLCVEATTTVGIEVVSL